jgi:L-aspartate oxidase
MQALSDGRAAQPAPDGRAAQPPPSSRAEYEAASLTLAAQAVLAAAAERTESRGCHVRTDYPDRDDVRWRRSLVVRLAGSGAPEVVGALPAGAFGDAGPRRPRPGGLACAVPAEAAR